MFGGTFYQSFSATLPAPNPTWIFEGLVSDSNNILTKIVYSDNTQVNARTISFNSVTATSYPYNMFIKGVNVLHQETSETVTLNADGTPVYTTNKYIYINEIKQTGAASATSLQIGYAQGQSQLLAYNGGTTNHFVNINGGAATWTVWGYIPTKLTTLDDITKYKSSLDTLLTGINTNTPTSVRVDKPFGYLWIETNSGQTSEVNWVAGIKTIII